MSSYCIAFYRQKSKFFPESPKGRGRKKERESVCYERNHLGREGSDASQTMRVDPANSACRRRLQTKASGVDRVFIVSVVGKGGVESVK